MHRDYFLEMYAYTNWANRKLWDCVLTLSRDDYMKPLDYSVGSIFMQTIHTMGVEYWWVHFLETGELRFLDDEIIETLLERPALRLFWDKVHGENTAYIITLTESELQRKVKPPFWEDQQAEITVAQALTQVFIHSADHRAQTLAMLYAMGAPTVGQDYLDYLHR